ncbi:DNA-binding LacI/PurR family transcriptional regulator [Thermocatellispora tengchongensis]|uniref:DNA-binding LacI/PurR family transcriptional regulator n=2 Tax=Thermocatellispora tengchongensis TaxID=1073253 RepID=A0A840PDW6_9ACTN|nr:LacI family DNA-binding transcriptional regulator [Thermocatellispora tengchongensis]MBB5135630.1 DNA-binding LacI/PurR family transcriptional regulator [Thermocatellispora tengchongensis]
MTSTDVARETGLSRATVSFVLNDTPNQSIPQATRQRVLEAAARLGYTPYAPARTLRSGRSDLIVCELPDWPQSPTMAEFVDRAGEVLAEAGYTLVTHVHTDRPGGLGRLCAALAPAAVFGMRPFPPQDVEAMRRARVGVILPPPQAGSGDDLGASVWTTGIGRMQAEHLIAKGHTRIACALPDDPRVSDLSAGRAAGAAQACADAGLPAPARSPVPLDIDGAAGVVSAWRASPDAPTAVCAYNDEVALALLAGMRRLGLSAPGDLAVIGADDIPAARFAAPPLTTIALDSGDLGAHLARALLRTLDGEEQDLTLAPHGVHVVERESA